MPLITPPFRTSLLTANGVPFATDNGDIQTARDWWMYWNQLTDRSNSNSKLATAGTHADRPMPGSMPDGALYYENDRGVLYANTLGVWQYVAGTMFGTLSPDQRPTDLGTHDAGFDFRTIVAPAREFLWSQAEWIEVTPVQYGPHSARPNPATIVQGALYVEGDRGGVIYQVESPAGTNLWQYLAGTMWGTLVPDQRPTDLGTHDVGFDFRTNVSPAREFIWSGGNWNEVTPMLYGTHAQRVAATIANLVAGMAWMETDRGNVIYQNQSFLWIYVTGVMVAALASRPADLGANDAGFRFESTDTRQNFRWSGSAWVEITPPTLTTQTSPGRTFGAVYQNTSGKPIYATVSVLVYVSGGNGRADAYVDASASPSTLVASAFNAIVGGTQLIIPLAFIVLPTYYYKVQATSGGVVLISWVEWN